MKKIKSDIIKRIEDVAYNLSCVVMSLEGLHTHSQKLYFELRDIIKDLKKKFGKGE